jgi:serine/threonine protein phosphatase PrpC
MVENYFGITDTGKFRQNNEDTFIAKTIFNNQFIVACVIDGVGGYEGGEVAADIAKNAILDHLKNPSPDIISMLLQALLSANQKILLEKQKVTANSKMACVLTVVLIEKKANKFYYAHVGDTRLYLFRDNSLVKVTMDHSFVGLLEDTGRLNEEAAMTHPKRNEINKALGFEAPIINGADYIETGESPFLPGDLILLCSDGLTDMIDKAAITTILSLNESLEEKGKSLIDAANNAGGKDNITVVLVQNNDTPLKHSVTKILRVKKTKPVMVDGIESHESELNVSSMPTNSKNLGLILFLSLLALLSTGAFLWQYFNKNGLQNNSNPNVVVPGTNKVYDQILQDTINNTKNTELLLSDSLFGSKIFLQDTVFINKDSIHITGDVHSIITSDSFSKKNVPLFILPAVRYLLFESLQIQNVNVVINAQNMDALHFKDVEFKNAHLIILNQFKNGFYSGTIRDMGVIEKDSSEKRKQ